MAIKKGDHVRVISHEHDTTPDGTVNTGYGFGVSGTVVGFRNNRFHGRQAIVQLDGKEADDPMGAFVDWTLTDIEVAE